MRLHPRESVIIFDEVQMFPLARQLIKQLVMTGHELEFAKFKVKDSEKPYEVDFIIADGGETVPVECKSATSSKHTSLDLFMGIHEDSVKGAYVIHGKDLRVDGNVTCIPIYMTMFLRSRSARRRARTSYNMRV